MKLKIARAHGKCRGIYFYGSVATLPSVNRKWKQEVVLVQTILLSDIQFCKKFYVVLNDIKKKERNLSDDSLKSPVSLLDESNH